MAHKYATLLSPYRVTPDLVLKNRMCGASITGSFIHGPQEYVTDAMIHHYTSLARNGAAVLDFYHAPTTLKQFLPNSKDMVHNSYIFDLENPKVHNTICRLTEEVHYYGTKMLLYFYVPLFPPGFNYLGSAGRIQSASGILPPPDIKPCPKELFPKLIENYINTTRQYVEWGFDGVTFHCEQYLIAGLDKRDDEYGGSVENRARFLCELFDAYKKEFGPNFIIEGMMDVENPRGYAGEVEFGYDLGDTIRFLKCMEGRMDYIRLRGTDMADDHPTGYTHKENEAPERLLDYCRKIKAAGVKVPLAPNGGFQDPDMMETALSEGVCDLISLARPFICDSEYGQKILETRKEDIVPCLQCDKCHGTYSAPWVSLCAVNPRYGMDQKTIYIDRPTGITKKVAVIGGGPIGMRSALFAAERGHKVTLYEKTGYLGGQLIHADYCEGKWPLRRYRLWLINELEKNGIEIRLSCEPSKDELTAAGFDVILACTGAYPVLPDIEGAKNPDGTAAPGIRTCHDVWGNEDELGQKVVIIGGSEVGMETAIHLAQLGREVIVLTRQDELGHDCSKLHYITMTYVKFDEEQGYGILSPEWTKYDNLHGLTNAVTTKVDANRVKYVKDGQEYEIDCDCVIVGGGVRPNVEAALQYTGAAPEFYLIGDVEGGKGNLQRGNRSAFAKVCSL